MLDQISRMFGRKPDPNPEPAPTGLEAHSRVEREKALAAAPDEERDAAHAVVERTRRERHDVLVRAWHVAMEPARAAWALGHYGPAAAMLCDAWVTLREGLDRDVAPCDADRFRLMSDVAFMVAPLFLDTLANDGRRVDVVSGAQWERTCGGLPEAMRAARSGDVRALVIELLTLETYVRRYAHAATPSDAQRYALLRAHAAEELRSKALREFDDELERQRQIEATARAEASMKRVEAERAARRLPKLSVRF